MARTDTKSWRGNAPQTSSATWWDYDEAGTPGVHAEVPRKTSPAAALHRLWTQCRAHRAGGTAETCALRTVPEIAAGPFLSEKGEHTLMGKTSIEWTDASWNPVVGCTEVSPGCANCYAARLAATRLKNLADYAGLTKITAVTQGELKGTPPIAKVLGKPRWTGEVRMLPDRLEEPLHWKKPLRIFVCDMGDIFHEDVADSTLVKVFATMLATPRHTYQVLTKRAERMNHFMSKVLPYLWTYPRVPVTVSLPLPNVWLGVSVENQHFADERIPLLLSTPAAVRFLSCEPLLGPVNLQQSGRLGLKNMRGGITWVICGGESGANVRAMHPDWARSLRDQCVAAGVPFFFKQWGEFAPLGTYTDTVAPNRTWPGVNLGNGQMMLRYGKKKAGRLLDGREWNEFPQVAP